MKILFLHGWHSIPGGLKPAYLDDHGHEVINPKLPDEDFEQAVRIAQSEFDKHQPQVVVGSSRGGAVAMNIDSGEARLVLLCPAWKKHGTAKTVKPGTTILHSRADDVIPFTDSEELVRNSGLPVYNLVETGNDHRLADLESLEMMLEACEQETNDIRRENPTKLSTPISSAQSIRHPSPIEDEDRMFKTMVHSQIVPWIEKSSVPFFDLQKNPFTNEYENGNIEKERSGVLIRIGDDHFVLTAAHNIPLLFENKIILCMSWDDEEHSPIPITKDRIAVSDESTLDVAAIKLLDATAAKLLRRHTPISLANTAIDCQTSNGLYLIVGYPRAGTHFLEQKWNDPEPHEIETEPLEFLCKRMLDGWKHDKLKYSPQIHIVVGMSANAVSGMTDQAVTLPDHSGIEGISGCGIWLVADRRRQWPLSAFGVDDCKLVAIEHSYDEVAGRVAGTWIDIALAFLVKRFPETEAAIRRELS